MMKLESNWLCGAIIVMFCTAAFGGDSAKSEGAKSNDLYARISQAYLDGNWDELEKVLGDSSKEIEALSSAQQADAAYVRGALAQCKPSWWNQCKKAKKVEIRPVVWGHSLKLWYDPAGKEGVEMKSAGAAKALTVSWQAADMDNPEHAEHGYSKGDLCNLGAWNTIGIAMVWSQTSAQALANRSGADKLRLDRYQEFRGHLAGLYYGTPRARRWGLFLYLLSWLDKYSEMPTVGSRKAAGAMFLAEILANPAKYPSIPLPGALSEDGAEEKLAEHVRNKIEKHSWTIAEDKALREAIKSFAAANETGVLQAQKATLPNKLSVSLDLEADKPLRPKRDAWLKSQFDKAAGTAQ
ncbi:MAG: hypothetical protein ABSG67_00180 [Thermoguttaceae bacterium]|jgi:hypothetical protein